MIDILPDSDCMYIENNIAWFISRLDNILWKLDIKSGCCDCVGALTEQRNDQWRYHSVCVKDNDSIYCLPDRGESVLIYNLKNNKLKEIKIFNPKKERISMKYLGKYEERLYVLSLGLKEILIINLKKQEIENAFSLTNSMEEKLSENGIMIGKTIYGLINSSKTVLYEFDVISMKIKKEIISDKKTFYNTISYDGDNFWISGCEKEILIWNKKGQSREVVKGFTNNLYIIDFAKGCTECVNNVAKIIEPLFSKCLYLSGKIWFIPFRTDKIIFIDKYSHEIQELLIPMEEEDEISIRKRDALCNYKYFFEYIIGQRYIVLYSLKKRCHYIIDTVSNKIEKLLQNYSINNIGKLVNIYAYCVFFESSKNDKEKYKAMVYWEKQDEINKTELVGRRIYQKNK